MSPLVATSVRLSHVFSVQIISSVCVCVGGYSKAHLYNIKNARMLFIFETAMICCECQEVNKCIHKVLVHDAVYSLVNLLPLYESGVLN